MPAEKELLSCPFCGGEAAQHPSPEWRSHYRVIYHKEDCYLCDGTPPVNFTLLPPCNEQSWNRRAEHFSKERVIETFKERYKKAKVSKIREVINCPTCNKRFTKTHHAQVFCSNAKTHGTDNCKDHYWNMVNPYRGYYDKRNQSIGRNSIR